MSSVNCPEKSVMFQCLDFVTLMLGTLMAFRFLRETTAGSCLLSGPLPFPHCNRTVLWTEPYPAARTSRSDRAHCSPVF
jgi:hypothetical protein